MGDPFTVGEFAGWVVDYFPAKKYALVLWGDERGYGWKVNSDRALGPGNDTKRAPADAPDAQKDALDMRELSLAMNLVHIAIQHGSQYQPGTGVAKKLDLLGFDMGQMATIEVAAQVSDTVEVMVASQEREQPPGLPYKEILQGLASNAAAWDAASLGTFIVDAYDKAFATDPLRTMSAIRLSNKPSAPSGPSYFGLLLSDVSSFAGALRGALEEPDSGECEDVHDKVEDNVQIILKGVRWSTQEFLDQNYVDLQDFASRVQRSKICNNNKLSAGSVVEDLSGIDLVIQEPKTILANRHGGSRTGAYGLSIYFPREEVQPELACSPGRPGQDQQRSCGFDNPFPSQTLYAKDAAILSRVLRQPSGSSTHPHPQTPGLVFPKANQWDEFLHRYYKPVADACVRTSSGCVHGDVFSPVTVFVGQRVTLSGAGSSDPDGQGRADDRPEHVGGIEHWYWDFDTARDHDKADPLYALPPAKVDGDSCTEDCDRDAAPGVDSRAPDDDPDAQGVTVEWMCPAPKVYRLRLMVWDEHHDLGPAHGEESHLEHWNVDTDHIWVRCVVAPFAPPTSTVTPTDRPDVTITPVTPTPTFTPRPQGAVPPTPTPTPTLIPTVTITPTPTPAGIPAPNYLTGIYLDISATDPRHTTHYQVHFGDPLLELERNLYLYDWALLGECLRGSFQVDDAAIPPARWRARWYHEPCSEVEEQTMQIKVQVSRGGRSVIITHKAVGAAIARPGP